MGYKIDKPYEPTKQEMIQMSNLFSESKGILSLIHSAYHSVHQAYSYEFLFDESRIDFRLKEVLIPLKATMVGKYDGKPMNFSAQEMIRVRSADASALGSLVDGVMAKLRTVLLNAESRSVDLGIQKVLNDTSIRIH